MSAFNIYIRNPTYGLVMHIDTGHKAWTYSDFKARPRPDCEDDPANLAAAHKKFRRGGEVGYDANHTLILNFGYNEYLHLHGFMWAEDGVQGGKATVSYGANIALPTACDWTASVVSE